MLLGLSKVRSLERRPGIFTNCDLILRISHEIFDTRTSDHSTPEHQYFGMSHVGKLKKITENECGARTRG